MKAVESCRVILTATDATKKCKHHADIKAGFEVFSFICISHSMPLVKDQTAAIAHDSSHLESSRHPAFSQRHVKYNSAVRITAMIDFGW